MCGFVRIGQYSAEIWLFKINIRNQTEPNNLNIEKIAFKFVQMKSLAMQNFSFDIFTVGHLQKIFIEHDVYLIY